MESISSQEPTPKVLYSDVAVAFIPHYFEHIASESLSIEPFYAEDVQLVVDGAKYDGKSLVLSTIGNLNLKTVKCASDFLAQPYLGDQILITAHVTNESTAYIMTFILKEVNDTHQYGITRQLIHKVPQ